MSQSPDDEFDELLRRSMTARPEAPAPSNLAARAMAIARSADAELAVIARVNRWNRVITAIAAVIIVSISGWVFHARWSTGGFQAWSETTTSSASDTSAATLFCPL